jgi:hypothetical protein
MVSGASLNCQNRYRNSSRIRKKIIPDPDPNGKKAPDPGRMVFINKLRYISSEQLNSKSDLKQIILYES